MSEYEKKMIGNSGLTLQKVLDNNFSLFQWWTSNKKDVSDSELMQMKKQLETLREKYENEKLLNPNNGQPQNNPTGNHN